MELLQFPAEIVEIIILQCDLPTLLQLRLVCKTINTMVNTSSRFPEVLEVVQIKPLGIKDIETFVESAPCFPFSSFYIHNVPHNWIPRKDNQKFHDKKAALQTFLERFCPHIQQIKLGSIFLGESEYSVEFIQALENVRELYVHSFTSEQIFRNLVKYSTNTPVIPFTKQNQKIKRLFVDCEEDSGEYLIQLIKLCPSLEETNITSSVGVTQLGSCYFEQTQLGEDKCYPYILRLGSEGHLKHLKRLDLADKTIKMDLCSPEDIQFFKEFVSSTKVSLDNVTCSFLNEVMNCSALPLEAKESFKQKCGPI